jgi:transposase-like protein
MEGIDIVPPDDAEEFVPPPKGILFYTLDKKRSIVAEAYAVGNSIKSTVQKWRVQPNQIRKWRRQLLKDEPIPQYPEPRNIEERTVIKEQKANKTRHKGRPYTIDEGILNGLLAFVEQVRDEGNAVTTTLVTVELLRRAPELAVVGFVPLCHQVLRFLKNHHLTSTNHSSSTSERRATHGWWHISKGINQHEWILLPGFNMHGTEYHILLSSTLGSPLEFIP